MHRPTTAATAAGLLVLVGALAGCAGEEPGDASPSPTASPTSSPTPTPTPTQTPTPTEEPGQDPEALPPGFPDPASLVGQEAYDERDPDGGGWHTVVGGEPLDLTNTFGACFEGGTDDVCAYSLSAAGPAADDGTPAPSEAALLMLMASTGERSDGSPTWEVLDAVVTRPPDGEQAVLQSCEGEEAVAFYPAADADAEDSDTIPVAAAWGPDDEVSGLVELDPDEVTCEAMTA